MLRHGTIPWIAWPVWCVWDQWMNGMVRPLRVRHENLTRDILMDGSSCCCRPRLLPYASQSHARRSLFTGNAHLSLKAVTGDVMCAVWRLAWQVNEWLSIKSKVLKLLRVTWCIQYDGRAWWVTVLQAEKSVFAAAYWGTLSFYFFLNKLKNREWPWDLWGWQLHPRRWKLFGSLVCTLHTSFCLLVLFNYLILLLFNFNG